MFGHISRFLGEVNILPRLTARSNANVNHARLILLREVPKVMNSEGKFAISCNCDLRTTSLMSHSYFDIGGDVDTQRCVGSIKNTEIYRDFVCTAFEYLYIILKQGIYSHVMLSCYLCFYLSNLRICEYSHHPLG